MSKDPDSWHKESSDRQEVVTLPAKQASQPLVPPGMRVPTPLEHPAVHVAANLHDLVAGIPITPEEADAIRHRRQLNEMVHRMLIFGLAISTAVILFGLTLDLILKRAVPSTAPEIKETLARIRVMRPSGFLTLGLLILIATPILRVVGSFAVFVYERDWRYAGITLLVLLILAISLISGGG